MVLRVCVSSLSRTHFLIGVHENCHGGKTSISLSANVRYSSKLFVTLSVQGGPRRYDVSESIYVCSSAGVDVRFRTGNPHVDNADKVSFSSETPKTIFAILYILCFVTDARIFFEINQKLENVAINDVLPLKADRRDGIADLKCCWSLGHQRPNFDGYIYIHYAAPPYSACISAMYFLPFGNVLVGFGFCVQRVGSTMKNSRRVGENSDIILSRLWTKVHEISR